MSSAAETSIFYDSYMNTYYASFGEYDVSTHAMLYSGDSLYDGSDYIYPDLILSADTVAATSSILNIGVNNDASIHLEVTGSTAVLTVTYEAVTGYVPVEKTFYSELIGTEYYVEYETVTGTVTQTLTITEFSSEKFAEIMGLY